MRRRGPVAQGDELPPAIAAGPDPRRWSSDLAWRVAGRDWSVEHGRGQNGWLDLLPADVRYAVSSLGRAHLRAGLVPPWGGDPPRW